MSRWEGESPLTQLEISPGYIPSAAAWPCPIREKGASNWFGKTRVLLASKRANRKKEVDYRALHTRLQHLSFQVLLDRLVVRRHFYLAIQIAKYLRMPDVEGSSRILAHWACYKVKQTQLDREQVARDIADKLGYAPGVSYSEIAKKAADCGRTQLAIKLIDYEPRASLQVPLLLKLGEDIPSLVKAIDSGDTDLVYIVLLHLRDNMPMAEFQMTIRNYPLAQSLYLKYCRDHNIETLRDIYDQEDNHNAKAAFYLKESYEPKLANALVVLSSTAEDGEIEVRISSGLPLEPRVPGSSSVQGPPSCRPGRRYNLIPPRSVIRFFITTKNSTTKAASLESAKQSYRSARNEFAATMCEEQQKLLKYQNTLEDKFRREFVGLSLHDTVHLLLMLHEVKLAEKLRAEYKVPDRRYWWLRILSLAALSEWSELDKFAKTKKSPIGYEPFVDVCLKYDKRSEAQKYLTRVKDDLKVKYYLKLGMLEEANNVATEHRDVQALLFVQSRCGAAEKTLSDQIDATIAQLTAKK
uniref:Vacuolar protein sorting-associated protein 16 homolog n=1 Tax=Timema californicum TaxID=61474 RepID=A0A7R9J7H0_TIMCA|nr:unnamed protein product [Timema californicum]